MLESITAKGRNKPRRLTTLPALPGGWLAKRAGSAMVLLMATNVLGGELACCCSAPATGFYRDGFCHTGPGDVGLHTVCAEMTEEFLRFSYGRGNDLVTPRPEYQFPGLQPGDRWCLCVSRWAEALEAGCAPPVDLQATHASALEFVSREDLAAHALGA